MESELWGNPTGLSGRQGRARLLGNVGPDRGDGGNIPNPASTQSHVPEQLRGPAKPRTKGTTSGSHADSAIIVLIF